MTIIVYLSMSRWIFFAFVYNHNYTAEMFQMMFNYFVKNV